jgi:hypothetical protein
MKPSLRRLTSLAAFATFALLLSACGEGEAKPPQSSAPASAVDTAKPAKAEVKKNPLQLIDDAGTPPSDYAAYVELVSGTDLAYHYNALAAEPDSYEVIAKSIRFIPGDDDTTQLIRTISNDGDAFKRRDAMTELTPKLDAAIAQAGATKWVKFMMDLDPTEYDFDKLGFNMAGSHFNSIDAPIHNRNFIQINDNPRYVFGFANGPDIRFLPVADEAEARKLQDLFARNRVMAMFYGQIGATQDTSPSARESEQRRGVLLKVSSIKLVAKDDRGQPTDVVYSHTF